MLAAYLCVRPTLATMDSDISCGALRSSSYTYKHIVQNLASCVGPLLSIGLFLIMGDVWTVSCYTLPPFGSHSDELGLQAAERKRTCKNIMHPPAPLYFHSVAEHQVD